MPSTTVRIASSIGLHAKPATLFAQAAGRTGAHVTLTSPDGQSVNGANILGVLSLGIEFGDEVVLETSGDNADSALDELAGMLSTDLDAD